MRDGCFRILSFWNSGVVWAVYDEFVMIRMTFFWSLNILVMLDEDVLLMMEGQYIRCEWNNE